MRSRTNYIPVSGEVGQEAGGALVCVDAADLWVLHLSGDGAATGELTRRCLGGSPASARISASSAGLASYSVTSAVPSNLGFRAAPSSECDGDYTQVSPSLSGSLPSVFGLPASLPASDFITEKLPSSPPLGTYANCSSPPPSKGSKRGREKGVEGLSKEGRSLLRVINRFAMQDAARALLGPGARVSACLRYQAFGQEGVKCIHVPSRMGARLGGLQTCGSVWACPICSAKVTERRRVELRRAVDVHRASGGSVVMSTYTFSHHFGDDLVALVGSSGSGSVRAGNLVPASGMMGARSLSMSGAPYQRVKALGLVGSVRSVELTHGLNGWHPHIHELLFLAPGADASLLAFKLSGLWLKGVAAVGLTASAQRGFDWTEAGDEIEEYIAKWGHEPTEPLWDCAAEITKQPAKLGRSKGRTPFQLLADFLTLSGAEAEGAGLLFQEYAGVMHGRRQLVWSRWDTGEKTEKGRPKTISFLTHLLGVPELTDEQVAEQSEDDGILLALLSYQAWRLVVADGRRAELWNLLREGDGEAVGRFIAPYVQQVAGANGSGRVVSTPRARLVVAGSGVDASRPVGVYPCKPWDALGAELGAGAGDLAERLYHRHAAGLGVHWWQERASERDRVAAELASSLASWSTAPPLPVPFTLALDGLDHDEVETAAGASLASAPPPARPHPRSGRTDGRGAGGGEQNGA